MSNAMRASRRHSSIISWIKGFSQSQSDAEFQMEWTLSISKHWIAVLLPFAAVSRVQRFSVLSNEHNGVSCIPTTQSKNNDWRDIISDSRGRVGKVLSLVRLLLYWPARSLTHMDDIDVHANEREHKGRHLSSTQVQKEPCENGYSYLWNEFKDDAFTSTLSASRATEQ